MVSPTAPAQMIAHPGNGYDMRQDMLDRGLARDKDEYTALLQAAE